MNKFKQMINDIRNAYDYHNQNYIYYYSYKLSIYVFISKVKYFITKYYIETGESYDEYMEPPYYILWECIDPKIYSTIADYYEIRITPDVEFRNASYRYKREIINFDEYKREVRRLLIKYYQIKPSEGVKAILNLYRQLVLKKDDEGSNLHYLLIKDDDEESNLDLIQAIFEIIMSLI